MFTININTKEKWEIDGKINFYSHCNDCSFKKLATIDKGKLCDLIKDLM